MIKTIKGRGRDYSWVALHEPTGKFLAYMPGDGRYYRLVLREYGDSTYARLLRWRSIQEDAAFPRRYLDHCDRTETLPKGTLRREYVVIRETVTTETVRSVTIKAKRKTKQKEKKK